MAMVTTMTPFTMDGGMVIIIADFMLTITITDMLIITTITTAEETVEVIHTEPEVVV